MCAWNHGTPATKTVSTRWAGWMNWAGAVMTGSTQTLKMCDVHAADAVAKNDRDADKTPTGRRMTKETCASPRKPTSC